MARRFRTRNTLRAIDEALFLEMYDFAAAGWKLGRVHLTTRQRSDRHSSGRAWSMRRGVTQLHLSLANPDLWRSSARGEYHYAVNDLGPRCRFVAATLEEEALFIIAHEVRHLIQGRYRRYGKVWGARGAHSERDADAYAVRICRKWRRERGIPGDHRGVSPEAARERMAAAKANVDARAEWRATRDSWYEGNYKVREYVLEPTDCAGEILDAVHVPQFLDVKLYGPGLLKEWAAASCVNVAAIDIDDVYHYLVKFAPDGAHELDGDNFPNETGDPWSGQ